MKGLRQRTRRRILLSLAGIFFSAALFAAIVLGTALGRQTLLDSIGGLAAGPEFRLEMRGLRFDKEWELEELAVSDATGQWLRAKNISAHPVFRDLLMGRITLERLSVRMLSLERLPAARQSHGGTTVPMILIRNLDAGHIQIAQAVFGHEALLSLHGTIGLDAGETEAQLQVTRLDRHGDALDLGGRIHFARREMDLRLELKEAPGGLLHSLLDVNGTAGISMAVSGRGPFRSCPLTLDAQLSDVLNVSGNATLEMDDEPCMSLQARIRPGSSWAEWTGLPKEDMDILAHSSWQEPVLRLNRLEVRSRVAEIGGNATLNSASGNLDARLEGQASDLSVFMAPAVSPGAASAQAFLKVDGNGLHARVQSRLVDWRFSGKALSNAEADFVLDMPEDLSSWQARGVIHATGPDLPEGMRTWTANATIGGDFASLSIDKVLLASEKISCDLDGRVDDEISLEATINVREISLGTATPVFSGSFASAMKGTIMPDTHSLSGKVSVNATEINGLPLEIKELFGRDSQLQASFDAGPDRILIHEATLQSRSVAVLKGELDPASSRFRADFDVTLPELRLKDLNLHSGTSVLGSVEGTPSSFALKLTAQIDGAALADLDLSNIRASAELDGLPRLPDVRLQAEAKAAGQPAALRFAASPLGRDLRISHFLLELPGTKVLAAGDLDSATLLFTGTVDASSTDLGVPGRILGEELQGTLAVRADLTRSKGVQHARVDGHGERIVFMDLAIGRASAKGTSSWPDPLHGTEVRISLETVAWKALKADRVTGALKGAGQGLAFDLDLSRASTHTSIEASGLFSPPSARLRVDTLQGTALRQRVHLESPLDVSWKTGRVEWLNAVLSFGRTRLSSRGTFAPDKIDIAAELRDMNPAMLRPALPGIPGARVNARLHVQGSPTNPDALLEVHAEEIRVMSDGIGNLQGLDATAEIRLKRDVLEARTSVTSASGIALDAYASCPVRAELMSVAVNPEASLSGRIGGYAELGILPTLLHLDDQAVAGKCDLDFNLSGTWMNPKLTGSAKVRRGRYENFRSGTTVESADVDAVAHGSVIELNATATDGETGKATGRGIVDLDALTYVVNVDLAAFRLLRLDLIQGTANGPVQFGGDVTAASLMGTLTLDPATITLPRSTAKEAPVIGIREINANATGHHTYSPEPRFLIGMNLDVFIPARLTVKGRGLDSEWSGDLHFGGNHTLPAVSGKMNLLRGTFNFLDRVFDLTKGSLLLSGESPPNPFLDMLGETPVMDTLVQVHLNGPARTFRLSLTSIPSLPQDELLAMVLFGRSMREISPLQAVALAQAATEMTGVGASLDVLGAVKSRLGFQEVDVRKDDDDNTSVRIGGYVGGKYYVRTQRSVSGQDRTKVEVLLTPKISVETEVGADSRQGAGINWKHDY